MAFAGNFSTRVLVPGGAASVVIIPIPRMADLSGNGFPFNMFSHYLEVALGAVGSGNNTALTASSGVVFAIPAANTTISVLSNMTTDIYIIFGKID